MQCNLAQRYYYVLGTAKVRTFEPKKRYNFCTQSAVFTITGDENCVARGFDSNAFGRIDTGKTAKTFSLTLTEDFYSADVAQASGGSGSDSAGSVAQTTDNSTGAQARRILPLFHAFEERGFFGEPFSQVGIFQGCEEGEQDGWCAFHASGWKFFARYGHGTADEVLDALAYLPVGTPVSFDGDMIEYGDVSGEACCRMCISTG